MKKLSIREATTSASAGKFKVPVILAPQIWKKDQLGPFVEKVYDYDNAELAYEEADGDYLETPQEREKREKITDDVSAVDMYLKKFYTHQNDEEGSNLAQVEIDPLQKIEEQLIKEDLAVWFGKKKKPKGSKQPKGPWVNICRKKEGGGHPPCGRPSASDKGYPKCRAAGVASKMSDSQKKAACAQKRRAEKTHSKAGTGNKPKMVSYKPKNESLQRIIKRVLKEVYESERLYPVEQIYMKIKGAPIEIKRRVANLEPIPCINQDGIKKMCVKIPEVLYVYFTGRY